ncbi:MAG: hypothetical protein DBX45_08720 [Oscillospiraceae bacterium]|nr:MAG: hypothetical protein DBX45_08720 [Oscillospiraceae bacterium]
MHYVPYAVQNSYVFTLRIQLRRHSFMSRKNAYELRCCNIFCPTRRSSVFLLHFFCNYGKIKYI